MWDFVNRQLDRFESRVALWGVLVTSGAVSIVTAWTSRASGWIGSFGDFAWVLVGLLCLILCLLCVALALIIREKLGRVRAISIWSEKSEAINPLDDTFSRKVISLADIVDPISKEIEGKTFTNCDLRGPCNLLIVGGYLKDATLRNCDIVELGKGESPNRSLYNVNYLVECNIQGGKMDRVTIFVPNGHADVFRKMGALPITDSI